MKSVKKIRLRSSTNCEDLPDFNGAGLYRSRGFRVTRTNASLEGRLLSVYASLWREEAYLEREFFGVDHTRAAMAVLINEAFTKESANGVIITIPDRAGQRPSTVWVNAQRGSFSVVSPEPGVEPESFRFRLGRRPPGEVRSRSPRGAVFVEGPFSGLLGELSEATESIERLMLGEGSREYGVDLEFKVMGRGKSARLFVKQARLLKAPLPQ